MRRFVDLHTHSLASDGSLPPGEIVRLAEREQLAAVALTDHDTAAGLEAARAAAMEFPALKFVPGIEVSALFPGGTLHILGLGIDENVPAVRRLMEQLQQSRAQRNPRIIRKLQDLGLRLEMSDVEAAAGEVGGAGQLSPRGAGGLPPAAGAVPLAEPRILGRLHIAQALAAKGYVGGVAEAFDRYLGEGKPAFVDKERLRPSGAIGAIRAAGGVAVLAHPVQLRCQNRAQLERILRDLLDAGLEGIEVFHSDHTIEQTRLYLDLAVRFDLMASGGSDFHGLGKPHVSLGRPRVPLGAISERFRARLLG